jgi:predicted Na+-dependent transporter
MKLQPGAIIRPAISMLVVLAPLGILQRVMIDNGTMEPHGPGVLLLSAVVLFFGAVTGFGAGRLAGRDEAPHGAAAAAVGFLFASLAAYLRSVFFSGSAPSLLGVVYNAMLMSLLGMGGGMLARRTRPPDRQGDHMLDDNGTTTADHNGSAGPNGTKP